MSPCLISSWSLQIAHRLYDFGNTSLVVGTQQGGAICHDDVFALVGFQLRELVARLI